MINQHSFKASTTRYRPPLSHPHPPKANMSPPVATKKHTSLRLTLPSSTTTKHAPLRPLQPRPRTTPTIMTNTAPPRKLKLKPRIRNIRSTQTQIRKQDHHPHPTRARASPESQSHAIYGDDSDLKKKAASSQQQRWSHVDLWRTAARRSPPYIGRYSRRQPNPSTCAEPPWGLPAAPGAALSRLSSTRPNDPSRGHDFGHVCTPILAPAPAAVSASTSTAVAARSDVSNNEGKIKPKPCELLEEYRTWIADMAEDIAVKREVALALGNLAGDAGMGARLEVGNCEV